MSKPAQGPEAKIISLFTALPEESRRIVFDILKGQMATPRKVGVKKPKLKSVGKLLPENPEEFPAWSYSVDERSRSSERRKRTRGGDFRLSASRSGIGLGIGRARFISEVV